MPHRLFWFQMHEFFLTFTYHDFTSSGFAPFNALLLSTSFLYSFCMWRLTACWEEVLVAPPGGAERLPANLDRVLFWTQALEIPGNFTPKYVVCDFQEPLESTLSGDLFTKKRKKQKRRNGINHDTMVGWGFKILSYLRDSVALLEGLNPTTLGISTLNFKTFNCFKPHPNDRKRYRNIVGSNMLRAFGHPVATCCVLLAQVEPTTPNISEQGGQTHATCCAQQCCLVICDR